MGAVFGFLWAAGLAAVAYLIAYRSARDRDEGWRVEARSAGLTDLESSSSFGVRKGLTGRIGALRVSMERYRTSRPGDTGTRIVIDGLGRPSGEFAVHAEGLGSAVRRVFGGREIEIGDEAFDGTAYVQGAPRLVRAILDAPPRRLLGDLLDGRVALGEDPIWLGFGHSYPGTSFEPLEVRVSVSDGALRADIRDSSDIGERFHGVFHTILAIAGRLVCPEGIPARLAQNVRTDPLPAVRLANLVTLAHEYPDRPETREALRAACGDSDDEVRLRAAVVLGEEGWEVLQEIALRGGAEDSHAARAIDALGERLTRQHAETILRQSLQRKRRATARAAIRAPGRDRPGAGPRRLGGVGGAPARAGHGTSPRSGAPPCLASGDRTDPLAAQRGHPGTARAGRSRLRPAQPGRRGGARLAVAGGRGLDPARR